LRERLGLRSGLGAALILGGVLLSELKGSTQAAALEEAGWQEAGWQDDSAPPVPADNGLEPPAAGIAGDTTPGSSLDGS
jgi:hypothetical protein